MKKIDILTNEVLLFLMEQADVHPDVGYTPEEVVEVSKLPYSEAQVYGALRRLVDTQKIVFTKESRNKKYKYAPIVVPILTAEDLDDVDLDHPSVIVSTPMTTENPFSIFASEYVKSLPSHMGNDIIEYGDKAPYIELLPLTKTANTLIQKHGTRFKLLILNIPPKDQPSLYTKLLIQSINETSLTGKNNDIRLKLCRWVDIANESWKNRTLMDMHKEMFDYRIMED